MRGQIIILAIVGLLFSLCKQPETSHSKKLAILKIEMHLSAFGVESDEFPSIEAYVDFIKDSSDCKKSYYNPAYKGSSYKLATDEIKKALLILQRSDLYSLKAEYKINKTDQPSSTLVIYTNQKTFKIKDYGLEGDYPLKELYKTVYKF
jgi:hypothetical protein